MKKEVLKEPIFAEKILRIIRSSPSMEEMREQLRDYHDNDIAQSLKYLNRAERNLLYSALDAEWLAEIISYIDDPVEYVDEIGIDKLSAIINEMDADDAVDLWWDADGERLFRAERIPTVNSHGTGCTLSSALAALRPQRADWPTAVGEAKAWLTEALRHADELDIGAGHGPVHHFHEFTDRWDLT